MKKVLKRITTIAMAFTLLSTGTAVTKSNLPKSTNLLTAHAEYAHNCSSYKYVSNQTSNAIDRRSIGVLKWLVTYRRITTYKCAVCSNEWNVTDIYSQEENIVDRLF